MEIENLTLDQKKELIEKLKQTTDPSSLLELAKLYESIDDLTNALMVVVDLLKIDSKYYYDCTLIKVSCLIKQEKFIEAIKILDEELSMPYIPNGFEEKFKEQYKFIVNEFKANKSSNTYSSMSDEEIGELLNSTTDFNILESIIAQLYSRNIRNLLPYINKYMVSDKDNFIKSLILVALNAQKVDDEIKLVKNELEYTIVPSSLTPINELDSLISCQKLIQKINETNNITVEEIAKTFLETYILNLYPEDISSDEFIYIAASCFKKALASLSMDDSIDSIISKFELNPKILQEYINSIEKMYLL